ncbi:tail protein X [uncultured Desulfuromusa sp.]|uniref:tail protein X n=1 Tax=uncultured Desulfuromusa sp. TaxID=219183 RepID=UPI002AA768CE|nr:tail protein X [uncultured Desulfuromusa sp.]
MAQIYRCQDGDMLDQICFAYYGYTSGAVEAVLEANPGLADLGTVYSAGLEINLPELAQNTTVTETIKLWD